MGNAICFECVEDEYLKDIILSNGICIECSVCHCLHKNAITVEELGKLMEPIMRDNFRIGRQINGLIEEDSLSDMVQTVLGQYFDFEEEIVDAVIEAEDVCPQDGGEPFFEEGTHYEENRIEPYQYYKEWEQLLHELKHGRRFFSATAKDFFDQLFDGVETLKFYDDENKTYMSVICELNKGENLYRARVCKSEDDLTAIFNAPSFQVGPPPKHLAIAGRMNAEGVVVFYGATDMKTCIAEMRPVLGGNTAVITLQATRSLRLLDFSRLEKARGNILSYFQPDFNLQVERNEFLRRIHGLISQPVVPGNESDYLITQTMAEYLAHVHPVPFDGIMFKSVYRAKGTNIVLFPKPDSLSESLSDKFSLAYVDDSIGLFTTRAIKYDHNEREVSIIEGKALIHREYRVDDPDDDFYGG